MSDQENIKPDEETDVEAHGSKPPVKLANDEGANDDSGDDDVELHKKSHRL